MPFAIHNGVFQDPVEGSIEISEEQYREAIDGLVAGKVVTIDGGFKVEWPEAGEEEPAPVETPEQIEYRLTMAENLWVSVELSNIRRQLEAIEEDEAGETPPDLLPGTRKQWLGYRGKVSNWKAGTEFFPDMTRRPVRPE